MTHPLRALRGYCAISTSAHCREMGMDAPAPNARSVIFPIGRARNSDHIDDRAIPAPPAVLSRGKCAGWR